MEAPLGHPVCPSSKDGSSGVTLYQTLKLFPAVTVTLPGTGVTST